VIHELSQAFDLDSFPKHLSLIISASSHVYADPPSQPPLTLKPRKTLRAYFNPASSFSPPAGLLFGVNSPAEVDLILRQGASKLLDLGKEVAKLRRVKSTAEKRLMRGAATRSARAHAKVRTRTSLCRPQVISVSNGL
jgi:Xaa-Pro aminopeptidase